MTENTVEAKRASPHLYAIDMYNDCNSTTLEANHVIASIAIVILLHTEFCLSSLKLAALWALPVTNHMQFLKNL